MAAVVEESPANLDSKARQDKADSPGKLTIVSSCADGRSMFDAAEIEKIGQLFHAWVCNFTGNGCARLRHHSRYVIHNRRCCRCQKVWLNGGKNALMPEVQFN